MKKQTKMKNLVLKGINSILLAFAFLSTGSTIVNADSTKTGRGSITFEEDYDSSSNLPATGEANSTLIAAIGSIVVVTGIGTVAVLKKRHK